MPETKKKALVVRDFTDAGSGESFAKGDTPLIGVGAFANYEAAGLIEVAARASTKPTVRSPAKKRARPAAKPGPTPTPMPTPTPPPVPDNATVPVA